jgi:hypothetical protein
MSEPKFLYGSNLWLTIKNLAQKTKRRILIAAPYIGQDSARILPLRKGDVLLCALTKFNSKTGAVCPVEIEKLQKRGVAVYLRASLHAKIYLLGSAAIVCSANLSRNSARLDEAGILIRDRKIVKGIREWFDARLGEPVTPNWLEECKKAYRPPKSIFGLSPVRKNQKQKIAQQKMWLIGTRPIEFPADEKVAQQKGYQEAREHLSRPRIYYVESIRMIGETRFSRQARQEDTIVQIWGESNKTKLTDEVYPHGKLLNKKVTRNKLGNKVTYIYIEMPVDYRTLSWERLRKNYRAWGYTPPPNIVTREVRDQYLADKLRTLLSPEKLRKKRRK